jgi:multiple sugar transport system permease protein
MRRVTSAPGGEPGRSRTTTLTTHVILVFAAVAMVAPFVWAILTSLKTFGEATQVPPTILPSEFQWKNYSDVVTNLPFLDFYRTTIVTTAAKVVGQVLLCSLAGYAFARIQFPGRNLLFVLYLSVLMVPFQLFLIPQYVIMTKLHWVNSLQALIVPGLFSAFGTFLLRQSFLAVPKDLEDAAKIDGCNHFQIYWYIMLPLVRSGLVALAILTFIWAWNDFLWPLVVINSPDRLPLSAGLALLQGQYVTDFPLLMAGATLATLPVIVVFVILQRQFIEGIATTGVKG